eukprot:Lankesteria_metandrocarpae@DN2999_c0_g1_i1.p1
MDDNASVASDPSVPPHFKHGHRYSYQSPQLPCSLNATAPPPYPGTAFVKLPPPPPPTPATTVYPSQHCNKTTLDTTVHLHLSTANNLTGATVDIPKDHRRQSIPGPQQCHNPQSSTSIEAVAGASIEAVTGATREASIEAVAG